MQLLIGQWTIETSLICFFSGLGFSRFCAWCDWRSAGENSGANPASQPAARQKKAQRLFNLGSLQLAAGQWAAAGKTLINSAEYSETPALHYLERGVATHHLSDVRWRARPAPARSRRFARRRPNDRAIDPGRVFAGRPAGRAGAVYILESLHTLNPRHPGVLLAGLHLLAVAGMGAAATAVAEAGKNRRRWPRTVGGIAAHRIYRALLDTVAG